MSLKKIETTEDVSVEVAMEIVYFVSPNGSVNANEILQQYVDEQNRRGNLKTSAGEAIDAYQIKRELINKIRRNTNLINSVKFYSQYLEQPLKEFVFLKKKIAINRKGKFQIRQ